jgi:hypothetical protein
MSEDFKASPILASSHANLAPATVHVAGVDTLSSEGIEYHNLLTKAGTPRSLKVYEGCCHPFSHWNGQLEKGKEFVQDTIDALKRHIRYNICHESTNSFVTIHLSSVGNIITGGIYFQNPTGNRTKFWSFKVESRIK